MGHRNANMEKAWNKFRTKSTPPVVQTKYEVKEKGEASSVNTNLQWAKKTIDPEIHQWAPEYKATSVYSSGTEGDDYHLEKYKGGGKEPIRKDISERRFNRIKNRFKRREEKQEE